MIEGSMRESNVAKDTAKSQEEATKNAATSDAADGTKPVKAARAGKSSEAEKPAKAKATKAKAEKSTKAEKGEKAEKPAKAKKAEGARKPAKKAAGKKKAAAKSSSSDLDDDDGFDDGDDYDMISTDDGDDADLDGDDDAVESDVPAAPAKGRGRDKRSKEKALIKEALASVKQGVTEEEMEARRSRLRQLIKLGKERGFLTYAEINDHLPEGLTEVEAIDQMIGTFSDMGISVYEQAPDTDSLLLNDRTVTSSDDDTEEEAEAALSSVDSEFGRTTDPVRMYMREMGSVELLTREGEIVIAKKIEEGLKDMMHAISACPTTIAEVLELAARALVGPGQGIIHSRYAFIVYPLVAQAIGAVGIEVPDADLGHDLAAMLAAITPETRMVFIANPNNPTGTFIPGDVLLHFLEQVPPQVAVVLDEAYTEYLAPEQRYDALAWVKRFPNLIVSRTFSKAYGLAGLRVGFAVAQPALTDLMGRVRQPFNVNSAALAAAEAVLDDADYLTRSYQINREGRAQLVQAFEALGLEYVPSSGNFVLVKVGDAAGINDQLLRAGIIVRPVANYGLPEWLRVSVGLPEENRAFIDALTKILGQ